MAVADGLLFHAALLGAAGGEGRGGGTACGNLYPSGEVASRGRFYVQRNGRRESEDAKGRKGGESDCVHGGYRGFRADMVFIPFRGF